MTNKNLLPSGWVAEAHEFWVAGRKNEAIQSVLAVINATPTPMPHKPAIQFSFYVAMLGDWAYAVKVLQQICKTYPDDLESLLNLGVCQSRSLDSEGALKTLQTYLDKNPNNPLVWDSMANVCYRLKLFEQAKKAGGKALSIKDNNHKNLSKKWVLPNGLPSEMAKAPGKSNVISFSLWGSNPRYLRGALRNALLAPEIYKEWRCQFHVDNSVPSDLLKALLDLGAELVDHTSKEGAQSNRERLSRRFWVANDPSVGYFLVRDCDSVIGEREAAAVQAWLASDKWFHVMRDWWTHTDLILAGMWGGVAGVLPDLQTLFSNYQSNHAETPNWDQWFLRDKVWAYIRNSCLVHDRYFQSFQSQPFPSEEPAGNYHVGQDEYAVNLEMQTKVLRSWINDLPSLRG